MGDIAFRGQALQKAVTSANNLMDQLKGDPEQAETWADFQKEIGDFQMKLLADFKGNNDRMITKKQETHLKAATKAVGEFKKTMRH